MNILFTTSEAAPFAKVGGLGDVIAAGSLPTALRVLGNDARVVMPLYGKIDRARYGIQPIFSFEFYRRTETNYVTVHQTVQDDVPFYFLEVSPYFGTELSVYSDWKGDMPRFILFSQLAMALAWELNVRENWMVDILHSNDWHTGLVPFLLDQSRYQPAWSHVRSVITLHNTAYQGPHAGGWLWELGVPRRNRPVLRENDLSDNLLAIGITYADYVTTVSPRHAEEIQYPYLGYGLDQVVRNRTYDDHLYGVLNGIDVEKFNPATDPHIAVNYDADNFLAARAENKQRLQAYAGLPQNPDTPIIGIVSRLVWQKGIDMAIPAIRQLLGETDIQFVVLGTGEPGISKALRQLEQDFPSQARVYVMYDAAVAQRIYAGIDIFLMPSRYEPCGIGQMIALRYGALPVVRETGGLVDTVDNFDNDAAEVGDGFVFLWEEAEAILNTLRWAVDTYKNNRPAWERMQKRGLEKDFSWARSARIYVDLYERIRG